MVLFHVGVKIHEPSSFMFVSDGSPILESMGTTLGNTRNVLTTGLVKTPETNSEVLTTELVKIPGD
jgi:hypothetical protein